AAGAAVFLDSLADCSDDDGGAPRDSQLDGVALDDGDAAGRMADEGGGASAGGLADLPLRPAAAGGLRGALRAPGGTTGAPDDVHLADTLVDLDAVGLDAEGPGQPAARDAGPSPARSSPGSPPPSQSRAEEPSMAAAPATTSQATETAGLSETAPAAAAAAFLCQAMAAPPRHETERLGQPTGANYASVRAGEAHAAVPQLLKAYTLKVSQRISSRISLTDSCVHNQSRWNMVSFASMTKRNALICIGGRPDRSIVEIKLERPGDAAKVIRCKLWQRVEDVNPAPGGWVVLHALRPARQN
ncbi:unnamed protein product, partial [Prorocentrum cordatum]